MYTLDKFLLEEFYGFEAFTEAEGRKMMESYFSAKLGGESFHLEDEENIDFDFDYYNY